MHANREGIQEQKEDHTNARKTPSSSHGGCGSIQIRAKYRHTASILNHACASPSPAARSTKKKISAVLLFSDMWIRVGAEGKLYRIEARDLCVFINYFSVFPSHLHCIWGAHLPDTHTHTHTSVDHSACLCMCPRWKSYLHRCAALRRLQTKGKNVSILIRWLAHLGPRTQYTVICAHVSVPICECMSSKRGTANSNDSSSAHGHVHDGWRRSRSALRPHRLGGEESTPHTQPPSAW